VFVSDVVPMLCHRIAAAARRCEDPGHAAAMVAEVSCNLTPGTPLNLEPKFRILSQVIDNLPRYARGLGT
jgi:hypothetical protein